MVVTQHPAEVCINVRLQEARAEWRRLCFVLEGIQATHLIQNGAEKFSFARTYSAYQAEQATSSALLTASIARGDYRFFVDRGVPPSLLCASFALELLRDWNVAIASKQARLAAAFEGRFGEEIDVFCATPRNQPSIAESTCMDDGNALWLLDRWAAPRVRAA